MNKRNSGLYDGVELRFEDIGGMLIRGGDILAEANGFNMFDFFTQITPEQIVELIPDQSTLREVKQRIDDLIEVIDS